MEESFEIVLNKWQIKTSFFVQAVATQDLRIITLKLTGQQSGNKSLVTTHKIVAKWVLL